MPTSICATISARRVLAALFASVTLSLAPSALRAQGCGFGQQCFPRPAVDPHGGSVTVNAGANSYSFTVWNNGTVGGTINFSGICSGGAVSGCSASPASASMAAHTSRSVVVNYTAASAGGTGRVKLRAYAGTSADTGWVDVVVNGPISYTVSVTPDNGSTMVGAGTGTSYPFAVTATGSQGATYDLSAACSSNMPYCVVSPSSVTLIAGETQTARVTFVAGASGTSGTVSLTAAYRVNATINDVGTVGVSVFPNPTFVGTEAMPRGLCLTIAAASDAAYECGDLRLVHALPSVRTLSTLRAPALLYNSQHAHPYPVVATTATLQSGSPTPDSVVTTITVGGQSYRRRATGSDFLPAGTSRRAVVAFDALHLATGLYDYNIEVRSFQGASSAVLTSEASKLPVVNRSTSPFGAGWWLSGYEQLRVLGNGDVLWIGGDGSTNVYKQAGASGGYTVYLASPITRPDTLLKETSTGNWTRRLPSGGWVSFEASGRHASTTNRLGYSTTFEANADGNLWHIVVPPATAQLAYDFAYTGSGSAAKLLSVTVPDSAAGAVRTTQLIIDGAGRLTSITDPGVPAVLFGYDPIVTQRVVTRTDRRGTLSRFRYDTAYRLASSTTSLSASDSIHLTFCAGETAGLTLCRPTLVSPTEVRTTLDGPRYASDVVDTTAFWLDRLGSPTRIKNALGNETVIDRGDWRFPGLVTRLRLPDGHITSAAYDERGNVLLSTDSSHSRVLNGTTLYARTQYQWDPKWNSPTTVTTPEGTVTRASYALTNGNKLWTEDGRGITSRTDFAYYSTGLLQAVVKPGGARDSLAYDAVRLNVSSVVTPLGKRTKFITDRLGRVTVTRVVLDTASDLSQNDSVRYDRLDRVVHQASYGPQLDFQLAQNASVDKDYDDEGNLLRVIRAMSPTSGIDSLKTTWLYDAVGRSIRETAPNGKSDSTVYDPAGNAVKVRTRRGDTIITRYDVLNRVIERSLPSYTYEAVRAGAAAQNVDAPWNPPYGGLTIPAELTTFAYDSANRIIRAANADARIARTYTAYGALDTDSLWIKTWARDGEHAYGITYEYDLDGRLSRLLYPANAVEGSSVNYGYDPTTGFLSTVTGLQGWNFTLDYNARSELRQVTMPGNIIELSDYDNDGLLSRHRIQNATPTGLNDRYPVAWIEETSMTYDARGKMLSARNMYGPKDTTISSYTGLGQLKERTMSASGQTMLGNALHASVYERIVNDPLGNIHSATENHNMAVDASSGWLSYYGMKSSTSPRTASFESNTGRILSQTIQQATSNSSESFQYDDQGSTTFTSIDWVATEFGNNARVIDDRVSYYDAAGVLRFSERRKHDKPDDLVWGDARLYRIEEAYRYDPLGRRILVRAYSNCFGYGSVRPICDISTLRRTIWDGNQEIVEIQRPVAGSRMPGLPGDTATVEMMESDTTTLMLPPRTPPLYLIYFDPNPWFGRVAYTHGLNLDRPLSFTRFGYVDWKQNATPAYNLWHTFTLVPHWNARGEASTGTFASGAARYRVTLNGVEREVKVDWPLGTLAFNRADPSQESWQGTLLQQKRDAVGTLYRRNRSYDPSTGRFTQEDPIGLAGGLNLYGFASGDPVNYGDPFGLCPADKRDKDGRCPGGLTVTQWNRIEYAATNRLTEEARAPVLALLHAGKIHTGLSPLTRALDWLTRQGTAAEVRALQSDIYIDESTFSPQRYSLGDFAFMLAHEYEHTFQNKVLRANPRLLPGAIVWRLLRGHEHDADAYGCANAIGRGAYKAGGYGNCGAKWP